MDEKREKNSANETEINKCRKGRSETIIGSD